MDQMPLLAPPIALAIMLVAVAGISLALSRLAFRSKGQAAGTTKPYACGEDMPDTMIQPDYGQFFPFAFFFTILHVVALIATTVPVTTAAASVLAFVYVTGAIVGLTVLYNRE
jgi:NADH-quinone oxidoreductase subunit A